MHKSILRNLRLVLLIFPIASGCTLSQQTNNSSVKGLKDYYRDYFPIGVAVNIKTLEGDESQLLL